jgi:hypothetical protein
MYIILRETNGSWETESLYLYSVEPYFIIITECKE